MYSWLFSTNSLLWWKMKLTFLNEMFENFLSYCHFCLFGGVICCWFVCNFFPALVKLHKKEGPRYMILAVKNWVNYEKRNWPSLTKWVKISSSFQRAVTFFDVLGGYLMFCKTLSRHFFWMSKKNSSNCLRKNSSSFSIGSKRKNGFSPSSELLHTKFQFWRARFSLPSHFPSPNTVAGIYRFCPKIHGRFVVLREYVSSGEDVSVNTVIILRNWRAILADLLSKDSCIE